MRGRGFVDNAIDQLHKNFRDKVLALEHYCKGELKCECCEEPRFEFLTFNHIAGGGNEDRKKRFGNWLRGGHELYGRLRQESWPEGYRVLCMNCQQGIRDNLGQCPHKDPPLDPHERLKKFDLLRVVKRNFELTLTSEYQAALAAVKRKGNASSEDLARRGSKRGVASIEKI